MSHLKRFSKLNYLVSLVALVIAPLIVLFLSQRINQTTTPDNSQAASVTLTSPRVIRVMEISYLMGSGDGATVTAVSNSLKQAIVDASRPKGSGTPAISGVTTVHSVTRNGPRPAGSNWQAGLQNIINQDNLCQKIVEQKVDQVWIWVDPNRDTVNGFNQEYAISSSWMPSNTGNRVDICNGQRSFIVLGLQYTLPADYALHSLGHTLEALIPVIQNSDLFWTKWSGSNGSSNTANICGNVHFPPNGTQDYDYSNQTSKSTRCPSWNPEGTGTATSINCTTWGCSQMGYMKWWMQQMPHASQNHMYNGRKIPTWLDFLVDFENAITYYVQNNYFVNQHFAQFVTPESVQKVSGATQQNQAASLSFAHTTTGNNRMVLLMASYRAVNQSANDKIASATYAGTPFTLVKRNQKGEYTTEIWYAKGSLANSGQVVVNFSGSVEDKSVNAISFSDVDQTNPLHNMSGAENGNTGGGGNTVNKTVSVSVPSANDQIVVGVLSVYTGNGNEVVVVDPAQPLYSRDTENVRGRGSIRPSSGSSTTLSWQLSADWPWSASAVAVRKSTVTPSPAPPTTPPPSGTAPKAPGLSAPANNATLSNYTPTFTWTKPTGGASYRLQVSENSSFSNTVINTTLSALTYTPTTNLPGGKTYYWRVQAMNNTGLPGPWSAVRSFNLISDMIPTLQSPGNGSIISTLTASFDWSDIPGATGYQLQVSTVQSFSSTVVNVTRATSDYDHTANLAKNKVHYWRVRPKFGSVNGNFSPVYSFTTANPPSVPVNHLPAKGGILTEATSRTGNVLRPRLSWTTTDSAAIADPTSYDIQISKNSAFTTMVIEKTVAGTDLGGSTATSIKRYWDIDQNLENANTYYWRVRASSSQGHKSGWSAAFSFKTPLASVQTLSTPPNNSVQTTLRPTFDWSDVPGAVSYSVYVKYGTAAETLLGTTAAATSTTPSPSTYTPTADLKINSQVTWRVRANSSAFGNSFSNTFVFTTANPPSVPKLHLPATGGLLTVATSRTNNVLRPRLSWTVADSATIADPTSYDIQISKNSAFTTVVMEKSVAGTDLGGSTATALKRYWDVDQNLENATTYYWRVRSSASNGHKSNWSAAFSFKTPIASPTGLSSPVNNSTPNNLRPTFNWADVPGAVSYSVYIKYGTAAETLLGTTKAATATVPSPSEFTPTADLKRNSQVTWRVRANSSAFGNAFSSSLGFNTPNPPNASVLAKPATGAKVTTVRPTLQWSTTYSASIPQPDSYDIQISTSSTFESGNIERSVPGTVVSTTSTKDTRSWVVDTNLSSNTTYYWRVRAKKGGQLANWSSKFSFKTP